MPFATHQRKIDFKLETLSCEAQKLEIVKGIETSFEVELPGGSTVQLNLLQHESLKTRNMPIKEKNYLLALKTLPINTDFGLDFDLDCGFDFNLGFNFDLRSPTIQIQSEVHHGPNCTTLK